MTRDEVRERFRSIVHRAEQRVVDDLARLAAAPRRPVPHAFTGPRGRAGRRPDPLARILLPGDELLDDVVAEEAITRRNARADEP